MNPIETSARLIAGIIVGTLWMLGCFTLITWNNLKGRKTYTNEIM